MQPLIKIPIDFKIQPIFKACHIHNKCHIPNANIFWTIKHAYTGSLLLFIVEICSDHFIELILCTNKNKFLNCVSHTHDTVTEFTGDNLVRFHALMLHFSNVIYCLIDYY